MHRFKLSPKGEILLDGKKLECTKTYILSSSAKGENIAELTVSLDVLTAEAENE